MSFGRNWLRSLVAILIGNAVYFGLIMPHLPERGRHRPLHTDVGLLVDFWACLVIFGILRWVWRDHD